MILHKIPQQWQYSPRKFKFYACSVDFGNGCTLEYPLGYSKKEQIEEDVKKNYTSYNVCIDILFLDVPSAEDLLLHCYTFMIGQKARKIHECPGCACENDGYEHSPYIHMGGCMIDETELFSLYPDIVAKSISSKSIMKFYSKVRSELGLEPVSKQWDVKTFCESKGFIHERHPSYEYVYINVYNKL